MGVESVLEVRLSYLSVPGSGSVGRTQWSFQPWPGHRHRHKHIKLPIVTEGWVGDLEWSVDSGNISRAWICHVQWHIFALQIAWVHLQKMRNKPLERFYKTTAVYELNTTSKWRLVTLPKGDSVANLASHQPNSSWDFGCSWWTFVSLFPHVLHWKLWLLHGTANTFLFYCSLSTAPLTERSRPLSHTRWAVQKKGQTQQLTRCKAGA